MRATGDDEFLSRNGIDILVETARMWADLGFWRKVEGKGESFRIHGVTGPDEYTTVVNDNLYTNVMARFNLRVAVASLHKAPRPMARAVREGGRAPGHRPGRGRRVGARRRRHGDPVGRTAWEFTRRTRSSTSVRCGTSRTRPPTSGRCCCTSTR
ncbi:hypothetical protein GCM10025876_12260 [Demequina litorisediminis]|uniref:Glycoside hydrolase family 65 central catalytic domain-containing protein n=1 Tax=Demequina litorisediminis TaxID=1849022 RepID=A0ABQ6IAY8_9MICO|nr:hypothetical protein GCM10025876_12260 [Demequina litorisediminis]